MILIGGMTMGWFTPTEAAAVAVIWASLPGLVLYRSMTWRSLTKETFDMIETNASMPAGCVRYAPICMTCHARTRVDRGQTSAHGPLLDGKPKIIPDRRSGTGPTQNRGARHGPR